MIAKFGKNAYSPTELIQIILSIEEADSIPNGISHTNFSFEYVGDHRTTPVFQFHSLINVQSSTVEIFRKPGDGFAFGLYRLRGLKHFEIDANGNNVNVRDISFPEIYFWYSRDQANTLSDSDLESKRSILERDQLQFCHAEYVTRAAMSPQSTPTKFKGLVFAVGCSIHIPQQLRGFKILGFQDGLDYGHLLQHVNAYVSCRFQQSIIRDAQTEKEYSNSTPLMVIDFEQITAVSVDDARSYLNELSNRLFQVIAFQKGVRPSRYAIVIQDQNTGNCNVKFYFPGYSGNLLDDLNSAITAETIERLLPIIDSSPWVDLLTKLLGETLLEANENHLCLKLWSILELIAKKHIRQSQIALVDPTGSPILYANGRPATTEHALGKVYQHVMNLNLQPLTHHITKSVAARTLKIYFQTNIEPIHGSEIVDEEIDVPLWEFLSALYEIRNATAHSGRFTPTATGVGSRRQQVASTLIGLGRRIFVDRACQLVEGVVTKEI